MIEIKNKVLDYHHAQRASEVRKNKAMAYSNVLSTDSKRTYLVVRYRFQIYSCDCKDWMFRRRPGGCRHIRSFKAYEMGLRLKRNEGRSQRRATKKGLH